MIDKKTENWKNLPWWFKYNMVGINSRRSAIALELLNLILGVVMWFLHPLSLFTPILFLTAYLFGWVTRYGDSKDIW